MPVSDLLLALIRLYQLTLKHVIRAVFGPVCRFTPSCSQYAIECIRGHGALHGSLLSVKRLCRCHPFNPGGFDPPPPPRSGQSAATGSKPTTSTADAAKAASAPASTDDLNRGAAAPTAQTFT